MKTLMALSALLFASFAAAQTPPVQQPAPIQQPSPALDKLQQADAGAPGSQTFDGALAKPPVAAVDGSTNPAAGDDLLIVATPVVKVKPKQVVFSQWAAKEGGKIGMKWGTVAGVVLGAGTVALLATVGGMPFGWALLIGIAVLGLAMGAGYLLGKHLGAKKAKELQGKN